MTINASVPFDGQYTDLSAYNALMPFLRDRSMKLAVEGYDFRVIPLGETKTDDGHVYGASLGYIPAGQVVPDHTHEQAHATVHILQGEGEALYGLDNLVEYNAGMAFDIPPLMPHGFRAQTDTLFYATQRGNGILGQSGTIDMRLEQ